MFQHKLAMYLAAQGCRPHVYIHWKPVKSEILLRTFGKTSLFYILFVSSIVVNVYKVRNETECYRMIIQSQ